MFAELGGYPFYGRIPQKKKGFDTFLNFCLILQLGDGALALPQCSTVDPLKPHHIGLKSMRSVGLRLKEKHPK